MISPVILFTFITGIIGSFQVFTPAYIISAGDGGPAYASMFYVLYLYVNAFRRYRFGYAFGASLDLVHRDLGADGPGAPGVAAGRSTTRTPATRR